MAPSSTSPPSPVPSPRNSLSKPQPRPAKNPAQVAQILIHNRRREYLSRHADYFDSPEHELADPLLYDGLVRRFQSAAERQAEGQAKGYGRVLESSLLRGEAKLEQLAKEPSESLAASTGAAGGGRPNETSLFAVDDSLAPPPADREEGRRRWAAFLAERFVNGGDDEFEYAVVDGDEDLDVQQRRDEEEAWYDDEEPAWASDGGRIAGKELGAEAQQQSTAKRAGETGVQDF